MKNLLDQLRAIVPMAEESHLKYAEVSYTTFVPVQPTLCVNQPYHSSWLNIVMHLDLKINMDFYF